MIIGVTSKTGIDIAINTVWSCAIAIVNAMALPPTKSDNTVPAQVGQAMNKPVDAPIAPSPPPCFVIEKAFAAIAKLRPTS